MPAAVPPDRLLRRTWAELRRRKVVRAGATYAIVAWVVLQLAEITFDPLGLPDWALTWTVLGAVLGLPVVLVLAWFFDVSGRRVARDRGRAGAAGPAFAVITVLLTVAGFGWWLTDVYAPASGSGAESPTVAAAVGSAPQNSIAVLPFDDMSPQRDQRALADGLAEELLDRLARSPSLRVAARTSSFAFRDSAEDVRGIGRKLNVRWLLEGSLRKSDDRIRVTAQLIDAADGFHVWTDTYERTDDDLFALQDAITEAIAAELSKRISGATVQPAVVPGTDDAAALQAYIEGRHAWRQRTPASLEQAEALFRRAVERDPQFARAWSGLADTYLLQQSYGSRPLQDAMRLAEPAAVRAVSLDPSLGEAWASIGLLRWTAGQLDAAEVSLNKAIELDPRYEMAPMWLANVYGAQGRVDRQRAVLERAVELNPLEPIVNVNLAAALADEGRPEAGRSQLRQVLAVTPDDPTLLRGLATFEAGQGRLGDALRAGSAALRVDPEAPANLMLMMRLLAQIEDFDGATRLAASVPGDERAMALRMQELELRRGGDTLQPALVDWLAELEHAALMPTDRGVLLMAAQARLRAGAPLEAARLLQRLVGEDAGIGESLEPWQLEAASLLHAALRRADDTLEADRWAQRLERATADWLSHAGDSATVHYTRALMALGSDDRAAAEAHLQGAFDAGFRERWLLLYDPRLDGMRDSPVVDQLQQRMADEFAELRAQHADPA